MGDIWIDKNNIPLFEGDVYFANLTQESTAFNKQKFYFVVEMKTTHRARDGWILLVYNHRAIWV